MFREFRIFSYSSGSVKTRTCIPYELAVAAAAAHHCVVIGPTPLQALVATTFCVYFRVERSFWAYGPSSWKRDEKLFLTQKQISERCFYLCYALCKLCFYAGKTVLHQIKFEVFVATSFVCVSSAAAAFVMWWHRYVLPLLLLSISTRSRALLYRKCVRKSTIDF